LERDVARRQGVCRVGLSRGLTSCIIGFLTTPERHLQICRKLLDSLHVTSEERKELGGSRLPFSLLLTAAQAVLDQTRFLPSILRPDQEFEGVVIEQREGSYLVHECHEIGVARYSPVKMRTAKDLADALRAYVRVNGGTAIDGVSIDFSS
jgi:hypothetical protein